MGKVTRTEWKWAWGFAIVLAAILLLPYLLGFSTQGDSWRFSGNLFGVEDGNSYLAKMRAGTEGAWLYRLAYTTEAQNGAPVFLPYLILGKFAGGAALHEQLAALFHLARIAAGIAMVLAAYRFLACFVERLALRRFALILAALGGGFGWLLALFGVTGLEFYSPETFGFLALFGPPHLAAARALLLMSLTLAVDPSAFGVPPRHAGMAIGGLLLGAWLFQPLEVPVAWVVMGAHTVLLFLSGHGWRGGSPGAAWRDPLRRTLTAALISAPAVGYSVLAFSLDPVLRQWTAQNIIDSPAPWIYLAGWGVLLIPALLAAWLERADARLVLPTAWLVLLPLLIYVPVNLQRRLADGGWMALVVLCVVFLERRTAGRARSAAVILLPLLALPSAFLMYAWTMIRAVQPSQPAFLPAGEVRAMEWLDSGADPASIVVAGFSAGNALPAYTGLIPYIGHGPETLYLDRKTALVDAIFDGGTPEEDRLAALQETGARYVLSGPEEQIRQDGRIPGCDLIYRADGWEIWMVVTDR
jgi:hypothetical protein